MASVAKDGNGWRIWYTDTDGKRKSIRLGGINRKTAESIRHYVEDLIVAKTAGLAPRQETAAWLRSVGETLRQKLALVGLIAPQRKAAAPTLGEWIAQYIEQRSTVKPSTKTTWRVVRDNLMAFFGEDRLVSDITPADADRFREYLITAGLAQATVGKRLQIARQFFRAMVRGRLIAENPFADVAAPNVPNAARQRFVSHEQTQRILDACPNVHWRTIVALARYGGLRCPSEVLSLRWDGIDWEKGRMRVDSPKTEHLPGRAFRIVPIFPELRPYLEAAWDAAAPGAVYVVPEHFRRAAQKAEGWKAVNLRTTFLKIVQRAGIEPWPKLWQNLRASRETELVERFPVHVVANWIGNTPRIAERHYLQVTEQHYAAAVVQNPVQQTAANGRI